MELFGVRILGLNSESLHKLLLSAVVLAAVLGVRVLLSVVTGLGTGVSRRSIWTRKGIRLGCGALGVLLLLSIWFDNPARLATFGGLFAAGAAVASQNVIVSVVGYFVIVFGKVFDLGDRIQLGDVRGDVLDIGLFKTTVMEMGVPPALQPDPSHWISARQYTGRVVTVANSEIFKTPTYNYSRNFDFLWEELKLPLHYDEDLERAEAIVLEAAREATSGIMDEGRRALSGMRERYLIHAGDLEPRCFVRLTDNWVELSVRFLVKAWGVRELKDRMSRRILERFRAEGIEVASSTFELVRAPALELRGPRTHPGPEPAPAEH
jgi:small-conductance mechanosensitive channel